MTITFTHPPTQKPAQTKPQKSTEASSVEFWGLRKKREMGIRSGGRPTNFMVGTNFRFLPMDHLLDRNCAAGEAVNKGWGRKRGWNATSMVVAPMVLIYDPGSAAVGNVC